MHLLQHSVLGATDTAGAHDVAALITSLFIIFVAAKIGAEVFERLGQPAVVGEILAGVVIGPQVLRLVTPTGVTAAMSELGVIFLLFLVGLETQPSVLFQVGRAALVVALGGVALPFLLGYGFAVLIGEGGAAALFVGAALVATRVGITARVLERLGVLASAPSRIILGAAVVDDILGLLVLAVAGGFVRTGTVDYRQIVLTTVYALAFTGFMLWLGGRVMARALPGIQRLRIGHSLYVAAVALCLGLSAAAGSLGVAAIIGAFLAGVALSEMREETDLHRGFAGLTEFFAPFFLAGIGLQLNLASLTKGNVLLFSLILTFLAIVGKVVGCGLPLWKRGRLMALQVGVGMVPRGEVGIIVAQLGLGLGALSDDLFAVVLFVAVATTMAAPPVLARLFQRV